MEILRKLKRAASKPGYYVDHYAHLCRRAINDKRLQRLKGIHIGKTAVLIGNGPSVKIEDLELLSGYITFTCNRFHLCYENTMFRPNYNLISDPQMIEDFGEDIIDHCECDAFVSWENDPKIKASYTYIRQRYDLPLFSDPLLGINPSGATLLFGMQIAYYMGIKDFALYGVDHSFSFDADPDAKQLRRSASGDNNHFIKNYRSGKNWCPPHYENIEQGFLQSSNLLAEYGGSLVNISRESMLPNVLRVDFDDFIHAAK